jgi:hypothetical protein
MNTNLLFVFFFFVLSSAQYITVSGFEPNGGDIDHQFACSSSSYPVGFKYGEVCCELKIMSVCLSLR